MVYKHHLLSAGKCIEIFVRTEYSDNCSHNFSAKNTLNPVERSTKLHRAATWRMDVKFILFMCLNMDFSTALVVALPADVL